MSALEVVMARINQGRAFRCSDIQEYGVTTVRAIVQKLRKEGVCHIYKWERVGTRSVPQMILIGGPGEDAPIPPVDPNIRRLRKNRNTRRYYRVQKAKNPRAGSIHRKPKYGLRSYKLDVILAEMEKGRIFNVAQAAEFTKVSPNHMGQLLRRARRAKLICIYDWDTSTGGGKAIYGWRHLDMEDAPRPGKGAIDRKRRELKQTTKAWGWLYGQPATV